MNKVKNSKLTAYRFHDIRYICWLILLLGGILKLHYAAQVSCLYSPHDLGSFTDPPSFNTYGHLEYIQYLYLFRKLPDVCTGQYYQPPLFHCIGAVVLTLSDARHGHYLKAFETLQMLNMLFANLTTVYAFRLMEKVGKKDWILVFGTMAISFCPIFYIIGAELNNDCLMTMFQCMALYYAVCWYEKQNTRNILKIAVCIGLSMLAKTNGVLVAFSIGLLFALVLFKNRAVWRSCVKQFIFFGIICLPLGLCWNVYRTVKYKLPLNYVLSLSANDTQYIGYLSPVKRLGLPSVNQLLSCAINWENPENYSNIWGQTILTMNFDEGILQLRNIHGKLMAILLMAVSTVLIIICCIMVLKLLFNVKADVAYKILFPLDFLIIIGNYVMFAFQYPHICTMNFRYIVITQVLFTVTFIICHKKKISGKFLDILTASGIILQSALTVILYACFAV